VRQHEGEAEAEGGEHNERGRSDAFVGSLYFAIEGFGLARIIARIASSHVFKGSLFHKKFRCRHPQRCRHPNRMPQRQGMTIESLFAPREMQAI
jgi:hypothetical protein